MTIQYVAYGLAEDMVAELSAWDYNRVMGSQYRYYVMCVGDADYETYPANTLKEAKADAIAMAREGGVPARRV